MTKWPAHKQALKHNTNYAKQRDVTYICLNFTLSEQEKTEYLSIGTHAETRVHLVQCFIHI